MINQVTNRIVIVLPYLKARGTEKQALMLGRGLVNLGWQVSLVVVMGYGEPWLYEAFEKAGVKVVNLSDSWRRKQKGVSWLRLPLLVKYLLVHKPDVVMSRALLANRFAGYASKLCSIPFLATYSGGIGDGGDPAPCSGLIRWISVVKELIWRVLQGWPTKLVTVSQRSAENLYQRYPCSLNWVMPIQNGVYCPSLEQKSSKMSSYDDAKGHEIARIIFVGTIEIDRKGLDVLINAVEILTRDSFDSFSLDIVGDGPDLRRVKEMVASKDLSSIVNFLGESSAPLDLMRHSDLLVLPSRREGLPNVMLEAMSCGVCVIASSCPVGPSEVICHGDNGWLVPVGDSMALAEAMRALVCSPALRQRMAANGHSYVINYCSDQVMTKRYDSVLRSIICS